MFDALGFGFEGLFEGTLGLCSNYLYGIGGADIKLDVFKELRRVLVFKVCRIRTQRLIVLVLPTHGYGVEKWKTYSIDRQGWRIR